MIANYKLFTLALLASAMAITPAADALAQCTTCASSYAAYRPVAYAAYSPVTYSTYYAPTTYTGWYPGYWLGRANRAVWGASTYTAYYPTTYTAGYATSAYYAPSYSYAPSCSSCGTCSTCTASYAPSCNSCGTCSTCTSCYAPSCSTCGVQEVVMRPVCSTGCDACASCGGTCSSCASVTQAVYQETPGCVGCASGGSVPAARAPSQTRPTLAPQEDVPAERQYLEKPATESDSLDQLDPEPASDEAEDGSANFDAPRLFSPDDRAAQLGAPVWTAVYRRQISGSKTEARAVSHHQVMQDAAGWTSASQ